MTEPELLPCPFCGGTKIKLFETNNDITMPLYWLTCFKCSAKTDVAQTKQRVYKLWNTRK